MYMCKICNVYFLDENSLNQHYAVHATKDLHVCKVCDKNFANKLSFKKHCLIHNDNQVFKCKMCKESFSSKTLLEKHSMKHANQHVCRFCKKRFKKLSYLKIHLSLHTGEKPFVCEFCGESFRLQNYLQYHRKTVHSKAKPYSCDVCRKKCRSKRELQLHCSVHTGKTPYTCHVCGKKFISKISFEKHTALHAKVNSHVRVKSQVTYKSIAKSKLPIHKVSTSSLKKQTQVINPQFVCEVCDKVFLSKEKLLTHKVIHFDHESLKFSKSFNQNSSHVKRGVGRPRVAIKNQTAYTKQRSVNKVFNLKNTASKNKKLYTGNKSSVDFCNVTKVNQQTIKFTSEEYVACKICKKEVKMTYLHRHVRDIHSKTNACIYKTSYKIKNKYKNMSKNKSQLPGNENRNLQCRVKIKQNAETITCNLCNKEMRKTSVSRHMKVVHSEIHKVFGTIRNYYKEDKNYLAGANKKSSVYVNENKFACKVRHKVSQSKLPLVKHKLMHSKIERPFICHVCHKAFKNKYHLREHEMIHTGVKPFKCEVCNKCFRFERLVRYHMKIHEKRQHFGYKGIVKQKLPIAGDLHTDFLYKNAEKQSNDFYNDIENKNVVKQELSVTDNDLTPCNVEKQQHGSDIQWVFLDENENNIENVLSVSERNVISVKAKDVKTHHIKETWSCDECSETFRSAIRLKKHMEIHSCYQRPFGCKSCNKWYKAENHLKQHCLSHKRKPYKCAVCNKDFRYKDLYEEHMVKHSEKMLPHTTCNTQVLQNPEHDKQNDGNSCTFKDIKFETECPIYNPQSGINENENEFYLRDDREDIHYILKNEELNQSVGNIFSQPLILYNDVEPLVLAGEQSMQLCATSNQISQNIEGKQLCAINNVMSLYDTEKQQLQNKENSDLCVAKNSEVVKNDSLMPYNECASRKADNGQLYIIHTDKENQQLGTVLDDQASKNVPSVQLNILCDKLTFQNAEQQQLHMCYGQSIPYAEDSAMLNICDQKNLPVVDNSQQMCIQPVTEDDDKQNMLTDKKLPEKCALEIPVNRELLYTICTDQENQQQLTVFEDQTSKNIPAEQLNIICDQLSFQNAEKQQLYMCYEQSTPCVGGSAMFNICDRDNLPTVDNVQQMPVCNQPLTENRDYAKQYDNDVNDEKLPKESFKSQSYLDADYVNHVDKRCQTCEQYFTDEETFKKHLLTHSQKQDSKTVVNKEIRELFHVDKKGHNKCNVCNKTFQNESDFTKHTLLHVGKPHLCKICNKQFSHRTTHKEHVLSHKNPSNNPCENAVGPRYPARNKSFMKHADSVSSSSVTNLNQKHAKRPLKKHASVFVCETYNTVLNGRKNSVGKKNAVLSANKKRFICVICNKGFWSALHLRAHRLTHLNDENLYPCNICNKGFTTPYYLVKHSALHTNRKPFECKVCNKYFATQYMCKKHGLTHKTKPVCEKNKKESFKKDIKQNSAAISQEKSFCHVCNMQFFSEEQLNEHKSTESHMRPFETSEKLYVCEVCSKAFPRKNDLKKHKDKCIEKHRTKNQNEISPGNDISKIDLLAKSHVRAFKCYICSKRFEKGAHLKEHYKIHTGEKLYTCVVCSEAFTHKQALKKHKAVCIKKHQTLSQKETSIADDSNEVDLLNCKENSEIEVKHKESVAELPVFRNNPDNSILDVTCNEKFANDEHNTHTSAHVEKKNAYICDLCQKSFNEEELRTEHYSQHTKEELLNFIINKSNNVSE